ncbi:MAG: hypothetical protein U1G08_20295 [Verrucomicrobiota bacterium]
MSTPFLGAPFPVPGRIQAEFWDKGGEGVGYHFSGNPITNLFFRFPESQGRPGETMVAARGSAVLQSSEWLSYTIDCREDGAYAIQLKTKGPPTWVEERITGTTESWTFHDDEAFLHVELDGQRFPSPEPVQRAMTLPRVWLSKGLHHLRLVADRIADTSDRQAGPTMPEMGPWEFFTISVDWIELAPAMPPLDPKQIAGGTSGFRDGPGTEAQIAGLPLLLGELTSGEIVFLDKPNNAIRAATADGVVRTLAGAPGNAVQDGQGTNAGFGNIVDVTFAANDLVLVLEEAGPGQSRIRQAGPDGAVATLYLGQPTALLEDLRPGVYPQSPRLMTNRAITLSRVIANPSGEIRVMGSITDYRFNLVGGSMFIPVWIPYTRYVWFRLANGDLEMLTDGNGVEPPSLQKRELGGGIRYEADYIGRIIGEFPAGFVQDLLPGYNVFSAIRSREGVLYAAIQAGSLHRMDPNPSLSRLQIAVVGQGEVTGMPAGYVPRDHEILITARPTGRYSIFTGWSDGVTEPSRTLRLEHDLRLTAHFELQPRWPAGIVPGTIQNLGDHKIQFSLRGGGNHGTFTYRLERSWNLHDWQPVPHSSFQVISGGAGGSSESFYVSTSEASVSLVVPDVPFYYRASLLSQ